VRRPSDLLSLHYTGRSGRAVRNHPPQPRLGYKIHFTRVKYEILAVTLQEKERMRESHESVTLYYCYVKRGASWRTITSREVIAREARY